MELDDKMKIIIETETIKLETLENKLPLNKYQIMKQKSYLEGVIDTWNFIKAQLEV